MSHLAYMQYEMSPVNHQMVIEDPALAIVRCADRRRRKVAIVGAGLGKQQAPYDDDDWEVWALNVCASWDAEGRMRADRWFELHEMHAQSADDWLWIMKCPFPIYVVPQAFKCPGMVYGGIGMQKNATDHNTVVPNAVRFPLHTLETKYGGYWACTFAYQIALAMHEGFTDIGLYGVELAFGTERERTVEWACTAWWVGYAEGRGVTFHLPTGSSLGRHFGGRRYGVEYDEEIAAVKRYLASVGQFDDARARLLRSGQIREAQAGAGGA